MKARIRPCAGCGRAISGYTAVRCVLGCGAYYCRRTREACARRHLANCTVYQETPMADITYTDRNAQDDGVLVDLLALGVRVHLNGRPITRATATLFDALARYNPGGTTEEQAAAYTAVLGYALAGIADTAKEGEPRDYLLITPEQAGLNGRSVWIQPNDDGYVAMFPDDY
jgi:hypothetical protein